MSTPIAITGLGFASPLGTGAEEVWTAWSSAESGIRRLAGDDPRRARGVDPSPLPEIGRAAFVRGFQPREHIRSAQLRRMDWCSRLLVASAVQAAADAGLPLDEPQEQARTGLVVGSSFGNQRETEAYMTRVLQRGPRAGQPILFPNLVLNAAGGYAAIELSIRGPNLSVSEHDVSGEIAIVTAVDLLLAGRCDRVLVGGVDEFGRTYLDTLRRLRLLDDREDDDLHAQTGVRGFVPGEGAAALVLERAEEARARGRDAYATIGIARSGGVSARAHASGDADAIVARQLDLLDAGVPDPPPTSAIFGGASGLRIRQDAEARLGAALTARQDQAPEHLSLDELVGSWGARGVLAGALAALALARGRVPPSTAEAPNRIVLPGASRGGVVAVIALDR